LLILIAQSILRKLATAQKLFPKEKKMKKHYALTGIFVVTLFLLTAAISFAQSTTQSQTTQAAPALELYHIHIAKAAPGKLQQLIDAYNNAPAPSADEPQVSPIILRHREGSEWDLITITPLGKQATISAAAPPQAIADFNQRVVPLTDWHSDTFVIGPSWAVVQKALIAAKGEPVYVVADYRSLPGHRAQLRQVLDAGAVPDRSVLFAHVEGAPWNFLGVTRYDSWAEIGAPAPAPAGTAPQDQGMPMREHLAVHHDTIAVYISGGQPIRKN
jgi:hypothetical protein